MFTYIFQVTLKLVYYKWIGVDCTHQQKEKEDYISREIKFDARPDENAPKAFNLALKELVESERRDKNSDPELSCKVTVLCYVKL